MSQSTSTIRLHRTLRAPAERVYRAFIEPAAMCKWLPPHGFTGTVHEMDARVGGGYRMSFTNFGTGGSHSFGGIPETRPIWQKGDSFRLPDNPSERKHYLPERVVVAGATAQPRVQFVRRPVGK